MGERCDYVNRVGYAFYKTSQVYPAVYKMHPEFLMRLKLEHSSLIAMEFRDGRWHFNGIPIDQTVDVHSVEGSQSDRSPK